MFVEKNCLEISTFDIKEIIKLMRVALTIPVSPAACEQSLSSMQRLKN